MYSRSEASDGRVARAVATARSVASVTAEQDVTFLAAGVAYYAFVSLLPAAVLAFVVAVTVGGRRLAERLVEASASVLTETGQQLLVDAVLGGGGVGSATLISIPLTLWGALKVFRGLDTAFSKVYGVETDTGIVEQVKDSLVVIVSIGGSVAAMLVLGTVLSVLPLGFLLGLLSFLVLPAVLTVAFLPMYYVFPDVPLDVREVLPGAVFAGVGWTVLQAAFQAYVEFQSAGDGGKTALYGALGGVLLFITFLYFGATLVLVGAVVNVVLAGRPIGGDPGGEAAGPDAAGTGVSTAGASDPDSDATGSDTSASGAADSDPGSRDGLRTDGGERSTSGRNPPDGGNDRQGKGPDDRPQGRMTGETATADADDRRVEADGGAAADRGAAGPADDSDVEDDGRPAPDLAELDGRVRELSEEIDDIDARTVRKPDLESELKRYVRSRMRRGHARGWGPYLVLLYGTVMVLGAFRYLEGWFAIGAMIVSFLSTLGLYVMFVLFGVGLNLAGVPGKALDAVRSRRG